MNKIERNAIDRQDAIKTILEIQKKEISVTSVRKLQITLNKRVINLLKGDYDIDIEKFINRKKINSHIGYMQDISQGDFHILVID